IISNIQAANSGVYTAAVADAESCISTSRTTRIVVRLTPVCTIAPTSTNICLGTCAELRVSASGGAPRYTVLLFEGETLIGSNSVVSNATFSVCPTTVGTNLYTAQITDSNGCVSASVAAIVVNSNPVCTFIPATASVCLGSCVTLLATPGAGIAPYTIVVSQGGTPIATNVTTTNQTFVVCPAFAGTNSYSAKVTDSNGCSVSATTSVVANPNPVCAMVPSAASVCFGSCVPLRISATSGRGPYTNVLSSANGPLATNIFANAVTNVVCPALLGSNIYTSVIVDANGCSASCSAVIVANENPVCSITPATNAVCAGSFASFSAAISQGTAPFSIRWTGPAGFSSTGAVIAITNAQSANAGVYIATVSDANGCSNTCQALLVVNPNPVCTITPPTNDVCLGASPSFTVNPSSGTPPYRFSWTGPAGL